jgi:ubiquitin carboxyl-terminal hydrolase 4/11
LHCPDCGKISITFDPYFSVSLPIPVQEKQKFSVYIVTNDLYSTPLLFDIQIESTKKISDLKNIIATHLNKNSQDLFPVGLASDFSILKSFEDFTYLNDFDSANFKFFYEIKNYKNIPKIRINIKKSKDIDSYKSFPRFLLINNQITYNGILYV